MGNTTVTICEEIEEIILHPATYGKDKIKKKGLSCFFLPHCCTPAWVLSPDCYIWKWVKKEDAWEEVKKTFTCEDYTFSVEDAFKKWLWNLADPVPGFHIIPEDLTALFGGYIGAAYEVADTLPEDVKDELKYLANKDGYPFTVTNIEQARWLRSDHVLAKRIWPGRDIAAITYYNLIIMSPYGLGLKGCDEVALWAHELVHVHQYNQLGWNNFLNVYLTEGVKGYNNIWLEVEAKRVEDAARQDCINRHLRLLDVQIWYMQIPIKEKLRQLEVARELSIEGDRITSISERAFQILKPYISNITFTVGETAILREKSTTPVDSKLVIANCAEGLGLFDQECNGYPIRDGDTCRAIDTCGIQAHAGYYMIGSGGKEFTVDIDEYPSLYLTMKAEKGTDTCLLLLVHDKEPRDFMRRFVAIGTTDSEKKHCGVRPAEDCFTIKDDNEWQDYTYDLRKLREEGYPDAKTVRMVQFYSGKLCNGKQHAFHFRSLVFKK